ncbi:diphthine--ammonia ligase [Martiniozyma asiatica (nom. inval.)]|nr:diphthine--ammonia ligase [Martiniozyma asiatica]
MKFVALVSGGKDSCFNVMHSLANGHELVCLANLHPPPTANDELDSYMYQTVGHDVLTLYSKCIGKPMYRQVITGKPSNQNLEYKKTLKDETEDLYSLLSTVLEHHPDVKGVSVGAILSSYQRTRVEDVCSRLGLTSLAYLWQRDQGELMNEMCNSGMDARIIKVAAIGLNESHLNMSLNEIHPTLIKLNNMFGVHICGEGGEFETSVLDAPFFTYGRIKITEKKIVKHTSDEVWYLKMNVAFEAKEPIEENHDWSQFIVEPPLLNEKFQDIYDFSNCEISESKEQKIIFNDSTKWETNLYEDDSKIYISNLFCKNISVELQIRSIFSKLSESLEKYNLSFAHVQSAKLIVANMDNFSKINAIYTSYFTNPLPPARICVESVLPKDIEAHLSVVVLKDLKEKAGLHVQGRSYWAPSNIGPYSQTIANTQDRITRLSGQIPLIPKNMDLCKDPKLAAVMSLQHYDNVKTVTGFSKNLLTVCFVKSELFVDLANHVFDEYSQVDDGMKHFFIAQVTELPKSADIEWGGLAYKEDETLRYESDEDSNSEILAIDKVAVNFTASLSTFNFNSDIFYVIYCNPGKIETETLPSNYELFPVINVFDSKGVSHNFAIIQQ